MNIYNSLDIISFIIIIVIITVVIIIVIIFIVNDEKIISRDSLTLQFTAF